MPQTHHEEGKLSPAYEDYIEAIYRLLMSRDIALELNVSTLWRGFGIGMPTLELLSFLMSAGPAAVMGLADRKGLIAPGYDADLVLVDIDHMYEVSADELHSKSKNCPYDGALLYGKVVTTLKGGKVTFQIEE